MNNLFRIDYLEYEEDQKNYHDETVQSYIAAQTGRPCSTQCNKKWHGKKFKGNKRNSLPEVLK